MATLDQLPSGLWRVRVRRQGQRAQTRSFRRQADALAWSRKVESEQERGVWRDIGDADRLTLAEALTRYEQTESVKHKGHEIERSNLRVLRDEPLAELAMSAITAGSVEAMRDRWLSDGYAVGTANKRITLLSATFALAARRWGMSGLANPCEGLILSGATERERRVSDDEIVAICAATCSPFLSALIHLAVETAMRRGELCSMTWAMIDRAASVVHLPASLTKTAKARAVPLSPAALDVLADLDESRAYKRKGSRNRGERVFAVDPHSISTAFRRALARARARYVTKCEEAGVEPDPSFLSDLHYHDLRHEATTRLARIFNLHELMRITGHGSPRMLMRYYNPTASDFAARMREAVTTGTRVAES